MASRPPSAQNSSGKGDTSSERAKINRIRRRLEDIERRGDDVERRVDEVEKSSSSSLFVLYAPENPTPEVPSTSVIAGGPDDPQWAGTGDWTTELQPDSVYMAQSVYRNGWSAFRRTRIKGESGTDAKQLYLSLPDGDKVKNSRGEIRVIARISEGATDRALLETSGYQVYLSGDRVGEQVGEEEGGAALEFTVGADAIDNEETLRLIREGGEVVDSKTIVDVTDGVTATVKRLSGPLQYYKPPGEPWERGETLLQAKFVQGGEVLDRTKVSVEWDGNAFQVQKVEGGAEVVSDLGGLNAVDVEMTYVTKGGIEKTATKTISAISAGEQGQPSISYYIHTPQGRTLRNSSGGLPVQVLRSVGSGVQAVETGVIALHTRDDSGEFHPITNNQSLRAPNNFKALIRANQIDQDLTLYLIERETEGGITRSDVIDTVQLTDLTESVAGIIGVSDGPLSYYKSEEGTWQSGTTTLKAEFFQGSDLKARTYADITWSDNGSGYEFTVTKQPTDKSDYQNPSLVDISTTTGQDVGAEGESIDVSFRYAYVPPSAVSAKGDLASIPKSDAAQGSKFYVEGTETYWKLKTSDTTPGTNDVGWDPDGDTNYEGIWVDTGNGSITVTKTKTVSAVASGNPTVTRRVRPVDGTVIRNSDPNKNLSLEIIEATGGTDKTLTSGDFSLYYEDGTGTLQPVSNLTNVSSDYGPAIGAGAIPDGERTIYLQDTRSGTPGTTIDTITLADITDGVGGQYVEALDGREVTHYTVDETSVATGPPIDPSYLTFRGVFVPPGTDRTEQKQDLDFNFTEDSNGDLEVTGIGEQLSGEGTAGEASADVEAAVTDSSGTVVFDTSDGTDNTPITEPSRLTVEFSYTDSQTGETATVEEQIDFNEDPASFSFDALDGEKIKNGSGTLRFDVLKRDKNGERRLVKDEIDDSASAQFTIKLYTADNSSTVIDGSSGRMADGSGSEPSGRIILDETDIEGDDQLKIEDGTAVLHTINLLDIADGTDGADAVDIELSRNPEDLSYFYDGDTESWGRTSDTVISAEVYQGPKRVAQGQVTISLDASAGTLSVASSNTDSGLTLTTSGGLTDAGETRSGGIGFEYTHVPDDAKATKSGLTSIPQSEADDGTEYYVEGTNTFWVLNTSTTTVGTGEVGWDPDGDGTNEGVWSDTGQDSIYSNGEVITAVREGTDAVQRYIQAPEGTAIKNGTGTVEVVAREVNGASDTVLFGGADGTGGSYQFEDAAGNVISSAATGATQVDTDGDGTADELHFSLDSSFIDGSEDIYLTDGANTYDTITIVDVQDGADGTDALIGTTQIISGQRSYYKPAGGSWETGETEIEAEFIQAGVVASAETHVNWDGSTWTIEKDPTASNGSITVTAQDNGFSYEVTFEYTNASGITESTSILISAIESGEKGEPGDTAQTIRLIATGGQVFSKQKDGTYNPSSIQLDAASSNISTTDFVWEDSGGNQLGTGSSVSISNTELSNGTVEVTLKENNSGLTDTTTLVEVEEGTDSLTTVLGNENHTYPAGAGGTITVALSEGDCEIYAYEGSTQLTNGSGDGTFSVSVASRNNIGINDSLDSSTYSDRVIYKPGGRNDSNTISADQASVDLDITITKADGTTHTITRTISYSKSRQGDPSTFYYIRPTDGQVIRNSNTNTTLPLKAVFVNGSSETVLTSGDILFAVKNDDGTFTDVNTAKGLNKYNPSVGERDITDGRLNLFLRNTTSDTTLDSVSLADVTDGVGTGYVEAPEGTRILHVTSATSDTSDDTVNPSPLNLNGVFVKATGGKLRTDLTISTQFNNGKLEAKWSKGTTDELDSLSVTDSGGNSIIAGTWTAAPEQWNFEFTHADPNTGDNITFQESLFFDKDTAFYEIGRPDGTKYATNPDTGNTTPTSLTFEASKTTRSGGTEALTLDGSPYQFELWNDDSDTTASVTYNGGGTSVEVSHTDVNGAAELRLTKNGVQVRSVDLVDIKEGSDAMIGSIEVTEGNLAWRQDKNEGSWSGSPTYDSDGDGTDDTRRTELTVTYYQGGNQQAQTSAIFELDESNGTFTRVDGNGSSDSGISISASAGEAAQVEFTYNNARVGERVLAVRGGDRGDPGADAEVVSIEAESQVFRVSKEGSVTPSTIGLNAITQNVDSVSWSVSDGVSFASKSGYDQAVSKSSLDSNGVDQVSVTASGGGDSDTITLSIIREGSDALTVVLTNENHTFTASADGSISGSEYSAGGTDVKVFEGTTQLTADSTTGPADGSFNVPSLTTSNINASKTENSDSFSVTPSGGMDSSQSASIDIELDVVRQNGDTTTITKTATYAKAVAGFDAEVVALSAEGQVFQVSKDGSVSPSSIGLSANLQNVSGVTWSASDGVSFDGTTKSGYDESISKSALDAQGVNQVVVTAEAEGYTDTMTLSIIREGSDAITEVLSNESHTYSASADGSVADYSTGTCDVSVYEGTTQLGNGTGNGTFDVSASTDSNISGSLSSSGDIYTFTPSGMSAESATVELTITARTANGQDTQTVTRTISYSKSVNNQDFPYLEDAVSNIGPDAGLYMMDEYLGFFADDSTDTGADRARSYFDNSGNLYLNDAGDATALEYKADFQNSKGLFAVGNISQAKDFFNNYGSYPSDTNSFFGFHRGVLGLNGQVAGTIGGPNSDELVIGDKGRIVSSPESEFSGSDTAYLQTGELFFGADPNDNNNDKKLSLGDKFSYDPNRSPELQLQGRFETYTGGTLAVRVDNDYTYDVAATGSGGSNTFSDPISSDDADTTRDTGHTLSQGANKITLTASGNAGEIDLELRGNTQTIIVPSTVQLNLYAKSSGKVLKTDLISIKSTSNTTTTETYTVDSQKDGVDYSGEMLAVDATQFYEGEGGNITLDEASGESFTPVTEVNARGLQVSLGSEDYVRAGASGFESTVGMRSTLYSFIDGGRLVDEGNGLYYVSGSTSRRIDAEKVPGTIEDADKLDGTHLDDITFSDIAATPYTNSDARATVAEDGMPYIDFNNKEQSDYDVDGRVYWDLSSGIYVKSSNADHANPALLWSSANVGTGEGISVGYDNEDHPTINLSSDVARLDKNQTFSENVTVGKDATVQGNLTVNGTQFITNTETVEIQDNLAIINKGESGSGVTEEFSGWEVDRGTLTNYFFGFDESRDRFVVGAGTTGRQVVATREDPSNVTADGIAVFNDTKNRFDTEQQGSAGTVNVDQVDGYDGSDLAALDEDETITGHWTFALGEGLKLTEENDYFGPNKDARIFEATDGNNNPVDGGIVFRGRGSSSTKEWLTIRDPSRPNNFHYDGHQIWHAGNDGSGSGLDADTLDGYDATEIVPSPGTDISVGSLPNPTISHTNTSSDGPVQHDATGASVIDAVQIDGRGHVDVINNSERALDDWNAAGSNIDFGGYDATNVGRVGNRSTGNWIHVAQDTDSIRFEDNDGNLQQGKVEDLYVGDLSVWLTDDDLVDINAGSGLSGGGTTGLTDQITLSHGSTGTDLSKTLDQSQVFSDVQTDPYGHVGSATVVSRSLDDWDDAAANVSMGEHSLVDVHRVGDSTNANWIDFQTINAQVQDGTGSLSKMEAQDVKIGGLSAWLTDDDLVDVNAGGGLADGGSVGLTDQVTVSHATSNQSDVSVSRATVITGISLDAYGHPDGFFTANRSLNQWDKAEADVNFGGYRIYNVERIGLDNQSTINDGQLARDDQVGIIARWGGNTTAVLWDAHNVSEGTDMSISGGTGDTGATIAHADTGAEVNTQPNADSVIARVDTDGRGHVDVVSTESRSVSEWTKAESDINLNGNGLDNAGVIEFNAVSQPTNSVDGKIYYEADATTLSGLDDTGVSQGQVSALGLYDGAQSAWEAVITAGNSPYWDAELRSAETAGHVDKQTEWSISHQGRADFREVYTDELIAKTFTVDLTQALAGSDYLVKSVATLDESFTVPSKSTADGTADGGTSTLTVQDNPGAKGLPPFSEGDWLRLRVVDNSDGGLVIVNAWLKVTDYDGDGSVFVNNGDGTHTFEVQRGDATTAASGKVIDREAPVLDYGQSGQGLIRRTVEGEDAPYSAIETWVDDPVQDDNYDTKVMVGNLSGAPTLPTGTQPSGYGLYAGNAYLEGEVVAQSGDIGGWELTENRLEKQTVYGTMAEGGLLSWGSDLTVEHEGDAAKLIWDESVIGFGGTGDLVSAHVGVRGESGEMLIYRDDGNYVSVGDGYHHDGGRSEMGLTVRSAGGTIIETDTSGATIAGWDVDSSEISKSAVRIRSDRNVVQLNDIPQQTKGAGSITNVFFGQVYDGSTWTGNYGLSALDDNGNVPFELSDGNRQIGGWAFTDTLLKSSNDDVEIDSDGRIEYVESGGWKLDSDGSGYLAGGDITWSSSGGVSIKGGDTDNPSSDGLHLRGHKMGYYDNFEDTWRAVIEDDGSGQLASGDITWGTSGNVNITGTITATAGEIANWSIGSDELSGNNVHLGQNLPRYESTSSSQRPATYIGDTGTSGTSLQIGHVGPNASAAAFWMDENSEANYLDIRSADGNKQFLAGRHPNAGNPRFELFLENDNGKILEAYANTVTFAGWTANNTKLSGGDVELQSSGTIKNMTGAWALKNGGGGHLAGGDIKWTSSGEVVIKGSGAVSPSEDGLYLGSDYLGFHDGTDWVSYIDGTDGSGELAGGDLKWSDDGNVLIKGGSTDTVSTEGLWLKGDRLGYYDGASWTSYMTNSGEFYLSGSEGDELSWDNTTLDITGSISAESGEIGGWTIDGTAIKAEVENSNGFASGIELETDGESENATEQHICVHSPQKESFVSMYAQQDQNGEFKDWGIVGVDASQGGSSDVNNKVFHLGDHNEIAGWSFGTDTLSSGALTLDSSAPLVKTDDGSGNLRGAFGDLSNVSGDNTSPSGYGLWSGNAYIEGEIVASSGTIGGWTIQSDKIIKTNVNGSSTDIELGVASGNRTGLEVRNSNYELNVVHRNPQGPEISGYDLGNNDFLFRLGHTNEIAGFEFTNQFLTDGNVYIGKGLQNKDSPGSLLVGNYNGNPTFKATGVGGPGTDYVFASPNTNTIFEIAADSNPIMRVKDDGTAFVDNLFVRENATFQRPAGTAWTRAYGNTESEVDYGRTLQFVVKPSENRIYMATQLGTSTDGGEHEVKVHIRNGGATFTGSTGDGGSVFPNASGDSVSISSDSKTATWTGWWGSGSDAAYFDLDSFPKSLELEFEIIEFDYSGSSWAITCGSAVVDDYTSGHISTYAENAPNKSFYYRKRSTEIAGDQIMTGTVTADTINTQSLFATNAIINNGGSISSESGGFAINADGSGQLAGGDIDWGTDGTATFSGELSAPSGSLGGWTLGVDTIESVPIGNVNEMVLDGAQGILQITDSENTDNVLAIGNISFEDSIAKTITPWYPPNASSSCDINSGRCSDSEFANCDSPPYNASCDDPGPNSYNTEEEIYFYGKPNTTYRISYDLTTSTSATPIDNDYNNGSASASADAYAKIQLRKSDGTVIDEESASKSDGDGSSGSGTLEISSSNSAVAEVRVEVGTQTSASASDSEHGYPASSASSDADASMGALKELGGTNEFISSKGLSFNKGKTAPKRVGIKRDAEYPAIGGAILVGEWELVQDSNDNLVAHHPPTNTETTLATAPTQTQN